jgi:hypothetical protein
MRLYDFVREDRSDLEGMLKSFARAEWDARVRNGETLDTLAFLTDFAEALDEEFCSELGAVMVGLSAYTHLFNRFIEHHLDQDLFFALAIDLWKACGNKVPVVCAKCRTSDQLELSGGLTVVEGNLKVINLDYKWCGNCSAHATLLGVDCDQ